jgi:SAM-dependent methyltransferase
MEVKPLKLSVGIKSLFLQLGSLIFAFLLLSVVSSVFQIAFSVLFLLIFHALIAAIAAFLFGFDWWWVPIQFFFPLSAYFLAQLAISPYVYFFILLVFSALFWSTYRTQVPYYPSRAQLLEPILSTIQGYQNLRFADVGSGMGGLLIKLASRRADANFLGIEIAPLPWLVSVIRGYTQKSRAKFQFGDFYALDFSHFDVVFCYLSPAAMPSVWQKAQLEMRPGSLFLSYEFIVPSVEPDFSIQIEIDGMYLYGWRI